jgi:cytochrome P450
MREYLRAYSTPLALLPVLRHSVGPFGPWARFLRARLAFRMLLDSDIKDAHDRPRRADVLAALQAARYADGNPMSPDEIRDELVTLLLAGHDTTVRALGWAMYFLHLAENVAVLARLQAELDSGADPERLSYLECVCREALRLNPVVN